MDSTQYQQARLSRDARFDGQFFVAVKTTGIFCRPICPAPAPKENNVEYFTTSIAATNHGYRPCLRCRPDAAPDSFAWKGKNTSFERALNLINEGALSFQTIEQLAERLGITSRYLNKLFQENLGSSAKNYAQHQQLMFAKTLIQQTSMSMTEIAYAAGFKSLRRFNDCFQKKLALAPSSLRRSKTSLVSTKTITLFLSYRPPYNWPDLRDFLTRRAIASTEWSNKESYGRTFTWPTTNNQTIYGQFTATHIADKHGFSVNISINDLTYLIPIVRNIRRILDLDAPIQSIDQQLNHLPKLADKLHTGLRLPGTWNLFEAGIRAILGQQISVNAAIKLVTTLVDYYGEKHNDLTFFPQPQALLNKDLIELKMPSARRQTLLDFSKFIAENPTASPNEWLQVKGIGPWTVDYAKMRGLSDPNIWLGGDLGVKNALNQQGINLTPEDASPWQSYLTFQVWNLL